MGGIGSGRKGHKTYKAANQPNQFVSAIKSILGFVSDISKSFFNISKRAYVAIREEYIAVKNNDPKARLESSGVHIDPEVTAQDITKSIKYSQYKIIAIVFNKDIGAITVAEEQIKSHWKKHKVEFPSYWDEASYLEYAVRLMRNPDEVWILEDNDKILYRFYSELEKDFFILTGVKDKQTEGKYFNTTHHVDKEARNDKEYRRIK